MSTPDERLRRRDRGGDVAVADQVDARARLAQLADQLVVAVALEHDDGHLGDVEPLRLRDRADVLGRARVDVDRVRRLRPDRDLVHVERRAGVEHRAALGDGDHGDRVRLAERGQPRALERVDGDVDRRAAAVADLLAVVEHRRLVLLPLADHDDAVHAHGVEHEAHRVDRGAVGLLLLAPADPAGRGERRRFGDADELEGEVAVGGGAHAPPTLLGRGASADLRNVDGSSRLPWPAGRKTICGGASLRICSASNWRLRSVSELARSRCACAWPRARSISCCASAFDCSTFCWAASASCVATCLRSIACVNSCGKSRSLIRKSTTSIEKPCELAVELELHRLADLLAVRRDRDALELDRLVLEDLEDARRDDLVEVGRADVRVELLHRLVADAVVERDDGVDRLRLLADRRAARDRALGGAGAVVHLEALALDLRRHLLGVCQGAIVWKPSPRWPTISPNWRTTSTWPALTEWKERNAPQPPMTTTIASADARIQAVPSSRLPCRRRPMPFSTAMTATITTIVEMIR